jgi:DNA-directed RNA polymerase subunit omega
MRLDVSSATRPEGITHPSIDALLEKTDSKYSLVIYASKRARQINAYYSQLGEGLLEYVGPLVETQVQEKPSSWPPPKRRSDAARHCRIAHRRENAPPRGRRTHGR